MDNYFKVLHKMVDNYVNQKYKIKGKYGYQVRCNLNVKNCIVTLTDCNGLEFEYTLKNRYNLKHFVNQIEKAMPEDFDFDIKTCKIKLRVEDKVKNE